MNLYLIDRNAAVNYDEYDAFVIRAGTEQEARIIAAKSATDVCDDEDSMEVEEYRVWALSEGSSVEVLAINVKGEAGEILGSFNAG